jgi:hypothetical protein
MSTKHWLSKIVDYLRLIVKKWVLWLFVLLDLVGLFVQYVRPNLQLPTYVYGLFAIAGFFWAGYQVFLETVESYEESLGTYREKMEKLSEALNVEAILDTPNLVLSLIEGNEYSYYLGQSGLALTLKTSSKIAEEQGGDEHTNGQEDGLGYFLPNAGVEFFLRLENLGCSLDVVIIQIEIQGEFQLPFSFGLGKSFINEQETQYPLHLEPGEVLKSSIKFQIEPKSFHSNAQFASRLKDFRDEEAYTRAIRIWLEAVDSSGTRTNFEKSTTFSIRPLIDLYLLHWKGAEQTELIRLAGGTKQIV